MPASREELGCRRPARHYLAGLSGRLGERLRDIGFCRQRLRHLQENLEQGPPDPEEDVTAPGPAAEFTLSRSPLPAIDSFWHAIRQSATARVVLPEGAEDLEQAALRFLQRAAHRPLADARQGTARTGARAARRPARRLRGGGDLTRQLAAPLLDEAEQVPRQIPAAGRRGPDHRQRGRPAAKAVPVPHRFAGAEGPDDACTWTVPPRCWHARKAPARTVCLLIPASAAGKQLSEAITAPVSRTSSFVRVPGQADLMFLREQGSARRGRSAQRLACRAAPLTTACPTRPPPRRTPAST